MVQLMSGFFVIKKSLMNWAISSDHLASQWHQAALRRCSINESIEAAFGFTSQKRPM
jgi:hypothetical protein